MLSFYDWRNNSSEAKTLKRERPRRVLGHSARFETLEHRCLLSFLDITASSTDSSGPLTYTESTGTAPANELSIISSGPNGNYTIVDQFQTITLSGTAMFLGWTGSGTNTVTGPASTVTSLAISSSNSQVNNLTIGSIDAPTTVTGFDGVSVGTAPPGGASTLQGIRQPLTIGVQQGQTTPTTLTLDDSGGTVGQNWTIDPTSVSGASPAAISWTPGQIGLLDVRGGSGDDTFTVNQTSASTSINPGSGLDAVDVLGTTNSLTIDETAATTGVPTDTIRVALGSAIGGGLSVLGDSNNTTLTLDGSAGTADVSATLGQGQLSGLTRQPIQFSGTSLRQLSYVGGTGADTLTVDFAGSNPIPVGLGLLYDGGQGFNTLELRGGTFETETYTASNSTDGNLFFDSSQIRFLNLSPIIDTVPAQNFNFVAPANVVAVNVIDGPLSQGFQTTQINSGDNPVGFELINFANKANVRIDLGRDGSTSAGGEQITFNTPTRATGLNTLTLISSESPDVLNILATAPGVATTINSGGGNDQFTLSPSGLGAGGSISLDGGTGTDTLNLDAGGRTVNFTGTTVDIAGFPTISFINIEQVNIVNAASPPLTAFPTTIGGTAGTPFSDVGVGQFTDPDSSEPASNFTATIDWGDDTAPTAGTITQTSSSTSSRFEVLGSHTYQNPGIYPVTVNVSDKPKTTITDLGGVTFAVTDVGGSATTIFSTAEIGSVGIDTTPLPITVTEDETFTKAVVAFTPRFIPPITAFAEGTGFTAMIDWGDGTAPSVGTIVPDGEGSYLVEGTHLYLRETAPGVPYLVTVTIQDLEGTLATVRTTATVLSNDVVRTTADSGPGSLRAVIEDVNADQIPTTITFNIPGGGAKRIAPLAPLPVIAYPVVIDGTSQPGFRGTPLIEIHGGQAGPGADGLTLAGGDSVVQSLVINGFAGVGLLLEGRGGNRVVGNRIGTDISGTQAIGNGNGIQIQEIEVNTIGGVTPAERNIISGNLNVGLNLVGSRARFNRVLGNYIGTDVTGTASVPNFQGVVMLGAPQNRIGGDGPGMGNLISGNASVGIQIFNDATVFNGQPMFDPPGVASGNVIQGNLIGTTADGAGRLGNAQGIFINDASANLIGGTTPGAGNVVAGNRSIGIQILGDNATSNAILGNFIGTNRVGTRGLGNSFGVFLYSSPGNVVPRASEPNGNVIRFNNSGGIQVRELSEGPQVERVGLQMRDAGRTIQGIGVIFTTYLNTQRALNPANYIVTTLRRNQRPGPRIRIASVAYDEIYRIVTITFASPVPRNTGLRLRVIGTAPGGITDQEGNFLDGNNGDVRVSTGSDFQATFLQGVQVQTAASVSPIRGGRKLLQRRLRRGH